MIIELKTGTLLAQLGQVAFSTGASTLPQLGRFYAKRLSNKFILQYPYSYLQDSADLCNSCRPNSIHLIPLSPDNYLSSSNHPDSLLTIGW